MTLTNVNSRIQLAVALLCFALAGLVWALTRNEPRGLEAVPADALSWTICLECNHAEQVPTRELITRQQQQAILSRNSMSVPRIICSSCQEKSVLRALKCPQCGHVFAESSVVGDFHDRCPECQFSSVESRSSQH